MNGIIGEFRIGEDISVALDAAAGDPATVTTITAKMMPAIAAANSDLGGRGGDVVLWARVDHQQLTHALRLRA